MRSLKYLLFIFIISFISLSNVSAEVCAYNASINGAKFTYECTVDDDLTCEFKDVTSLSYKTYKGGTISTVKEEDIKDIEDMMNLKRSDFIDSNGNVDCNQVKSIKIAMVIGYPQVDIYGIENDAICSTLKKIPGTYIYKECVPFSLKSSGGTETPSTSDDDDTEFNVETFCDGPVQGVFTTLGWVFFILKILIPIILIVFGSIDFGKAMLSNKDDEIKKSAKTLVLRAIAGIIIFFIPTVLDFVVEIIGGDDIYNKNSGTFARCTHCMLEPDDETCRKLVE